MNLLVKTWENRNKDHCWLGETCSEDYMEDMNCKGCGTGMKIVSEIRNSQNDVGLATGICPVCGFVQRIRNLSEDWYDNHFSKAWLSRREEDVSIDRYVFNLISSKLPEKGRVLDVGCGLGGTLVPFKEAGFDVYGVDPSMKRSEKASEIIDHVSTDRGEHYLRKTNHRFELIYFFNVLQFSVNPFLLIELAADKLNAGGFLYLRVGDFLQQNFCQFSHLGVVRSYLSLYALKNIIAKKNLVPVRYNKSPFEIILRKQECEFTDRHIINKATRVEVRNIYKSACKSLHAFRLLFFKNTTLYFQGRKVAIKAERPFTKNLPVVFIHNVKFLPILLK